MNCIMLKFKSPVDGTPFEGIHSVWKSKEKAERVAASLTRAHSHEGYSYSVADRKPVRTARNWRGDSQVSFDAKSFICIADEEK